MTAIMKDIFDLRSFPLQMILSFILVVFLTTAIAGLLAIYLIRNQLEDQAWSQLDQSQRVAKALYASRQKEIDSLAKSIAQSPSLKEIIATSELDSFDAFVHDVEENTDLEAVILCKSDGAVLARASEAITADICRAQQTSGYFLDWQGSQVQVWMMAAEPIQIQASDGNLHDIGRLMAGVSLDRPFLAGMQESIGMEHTLFVLGRPIATTFDFDLTTAPGVSQQVVEPPRTSEGLCTTFELDCAPYYAIRLPLQGNEVELELALSVVEINNAQRRLIWILTGSMLGVAVVGSILGIIPARRISRPLEKLAATASGFSQGDLHSPVSVKAPIREVSLVAKALEGARVDLLNTMTELRREKAWSDHLLDAIVEGIMTLDGRGNITYFSRGAERITGWGRAEVLNRSCDEIFTLVDSAVHFSRMIPEPGQHRKVQVNLAGGRQAILAMTGARLAPLEAGEHQVALVCRDVSEEESVHRLLGQFMANVSHEFRTPLSSLAASIEMLLDQSARLSQEELDELLKSLHLGILRFQNLVDNLLESANLEAGHFRVSPRPYDLEEIINEAVNTMRPLLEKYGQVAVIDLDGDLPLVQADPRRTVQVLVNLISNASKYGPPDAEIAIHASADGRWVEVRVSDQGPGIPQELQSEVFTRFLYPSSPTDKASVGAGLGLSVVKAVVEAQGGKVGVRNKETGGAVFWFRLPVGEEE
jgi:PAS domain S-box-containing protein